MTALMFLATAALAVTPEVPAGYTVERFAEDPDVYHLDASGPGFLVAGHDNGLVTVIDADGVASTFVSGVYDPDAAWGDSDGLLAGCGAAPGDVVVANSGQLTIYDPAGAYVHHVTGGVNLQGMTATDAGVFLVADLNANRLATLTGDCVLETFVDLAANHFPGDVADAGDRLYVTDTFGPHGVVVLEADATGAAELAEVGGFALPEGIATDGVGDLGGGAFVAERGGGAVSWIDPDTLTRSDFATGFDTPIGVTVAGDGCLYVADHGEGAVFRICAEADAAQTTICHVPPGKGGKAHTLEVGTASVAAHLAHGDHEGACE